MLLKCGENQWNGNKKHKENPWEIIEIKMVKFNQKLFPKTLFFDFPNPSKNTKRIVQFKSKTSFDCRKNTREYGKIRTQNL